MPPEVRRKMLEWRISAKTGTKVLELKNIIIELKNVLKNFKSRIDKAEKVSVNTKTSH